MSHVFIDTWAWYVLADQDDPDHDIAQAAIEELIERNVRLLITNFVVDEAATLIRYKLGHEEALEFLRTTDELVAEEYLTIVQVTKEHEELAQKIFERYADVEFSYTDCVSFVVMQELKVPEVLTSDRHFTIMGFSLVPT